MGIDITARAEGPDSLYDIFAECKMRRRPTGFTELNTLVKRVELTKANVNPRYFLFSASGFTDDLIDYAELRKDIILVDLPMLIGDVPPEPLSKRLQQHDRNSLPGVPLGKNGQG